MRQQGKWHKHQEAISDRQEDCLSCLVFVMNRLVEIEIVRQRSLWYYSGKNELFYDLGKVVRLETGQ